MQKKLTLKQKMIRFIKRNKKKTGRQVPAALVAMLVLALLLSIAERPVTARFEREPGAALVVTMVGDMMFDRHVQTAVDRYGYESLFQYVKPLFLASDYNTGNFEQPVVLDDGYAKAPHEINFKTDAAAVKILKEMNFTTMNLANNHMLDYGEAALRDTLAAFEQEGVAVVGAGVDLDEAMRVDYRTINGVKIATLGFTDIYPLNSMLDQAKDDPALTGYTAAAGRAGVLTAKPYRIAPLIQRARHNADLVIVHMHWGHEYNSTITAQERDLARTMVDLGADIIIGHHPHVLKPVEIYNGSVIFYSLGNFIFDQGFSRTKMSAVAQYKLFDDGSARVEITPLSIREAHPRPLNPILQWGFGLKIRRILTKDLPDGAARIEDGGKIVISLGEAVRQKEKEIEAN
ncbi:MAG: CapA family protein [Bacillota bacterium]